MHRNPCLHARAQVSPTSVRGTLGSLNQLLICLGILAALLVNVALPVTDWRTMFNLAALPAAALLLGACAAPARARLPARLLAHRSAAPPAASCCSGRRCMPQLLRQRSLKCVCTPCLALVRHAGLPGVARLPGVQGQA